MPVSTSINQQTPSLTQGETRKQEHNRRAGGLRLFCQNLYFSLRATFKPLCPLAFFVHLSCTWGKQRKSLTHSFYQDCYLYKVCMLYKPRRDQFLESGVQSFTQSLSYCHTTVTTEITCLF